MRSLRFRISVVLGGAMLVFWLGFAALRLPPVHRARLLREQAQLDFYSRSWLPAGHWLRESDSSWLILEPSVIEQRQREILKYREPYLALEEWTLIYLAYRLQGRSNEEILALPEGSTVMAAAVASEADPPGWASALAQPLNPRPKGTFRLGLVSEDDFPRITNNSPPFLVDCGIYAMLRHDLTWSEAQRQHLILLREKRLQGHNAACLKAGALMRGRLRSALGEPKSIRLSLDYPARTGTRMRLQLKLLLEDFFRSLGYRIDPASTEPLQVQLSLRLSDYGDLAVQYRRTQTITRRVARRSYSRYSSGVRYETQLDQNTVREDKLEGASVPTLWLGLLGQDFALPPYGELDRGDLDRIQRLYSAPTVAPEEWFYWDYNIRVRASDPWRYGLDDFRHRTD